LPSTSLGKERKNSSTKEKGGERQAAVLFFCLDWCFASPRNVVGFLLMSGEAFFFAEWHLQCLGMLPRMPRYRGENVWGKGLGYVVILAPKIIITCVALRIHGQVKVDPR